MRECRKWVYVWRNYRHETVARFFHTQYTVHYLAIQSFVYTVYKCSRKDCRVWGTVILQLTMRFLRKCSTNWCKIYVSGLKILQQITGSGIHDITDTCLDANMTTDNWSLEGQLILKFANGKRLQCQQNNCCISSETLKMVYVVVHCTKHRFHRQR